MPATRLGPEYFVRFMLVSAPELGDWLDAVLAKAARRRNAGDALPLSQGVPTEASTRHARELRTSSRNLGLGYVDQRNGHGAPAIGRPTSPIEAGFSFPPSAMASCSWPPPRWPHGNNRLLFFDHSIRTRMPTMRPVRTCWALAILMLALAGCVGGPVRNIFPPRASIQQLAVQADGSWKLQLRLQNYSNVSTTFATVDAKIELAGNAAGSVNAAPAIRIGPESADVVETGFKPSAAAAQAIATLHSGNLRYKLAGRIGTSDPKGDYEYTFEGVLSPVPGLVGVLR